MSFASVGTLGTNTENTSDTAIALTTSAQLDAGNLGVVMLALDNFNGTDADHGEVTGVVDSAGNTWSKFGEYTNGQGGGGAGATVSIWGVVAVTTLAAGGTITATLGNARTAKAISGWEFALDGWGVRVAGITQAVGDAVDPAALTLAGLSSAARLWLHGIAIEGPAGTYTQDADYTSINTATGGGTGAAGMTLNGGFRLFSGNTDTVDVAWSATRDHVQILLALDELITPTVYVGANIRFVVGDRFGRVIAELTPECGPISWRLNDVGQAPFSLSAGDEKATDKIIRSGNRVYLEFDNGLPAWGGVMDFPLGWTEDGKIAVSTFSGEHMLGWRRTLRTRSFVGLTAGEIFQALILEANELDDLGISLGHVWTGGEAYTLELHYADVLQVIRSELCGKLTTAEFAILPVLENGRITFRAEFYERRGADKLNVVLMEGHNLSGESLVEYGPIVNDWALAGAGSGWGEDRLTSEGGTSNVDTTSIGEFGLRQEAAVFGDISVQSTLDAQAATLLAASKNPVKLASGYADNLAPALFADYDLGDRIRVILYSKGFGGTDTTHRVTTREFDPATGLCSLVPKAEAA